MKKLKFFFKIKSFHPYALKKQSSLFSLQTIHIINYTIILREMVINFHTGISPFLPNMRYYPAYLDIARGAFPMRMEGVLVRN